MCLSDGGYKLLNKNKIRMYSNGKTVIWIKHVTLKMLKRG